MTGIITIEGFTEIAESVKEYADKLQNDVLSQVQSIGQQAYSEMVSNSPVKTGFLQSRWQFASNSNGFVITNDCPYVAFQEFGTSRIHPKNWITPAYETMRSDIDALIQQYSSK